MGKRIANFKASLRRYRVLIWFAVGLFALDRAVGAQARTWDAYDPQPSRDRLVECRQGRWDILIVGGSPAACGIDPGVLAGVTWKGGQLRKAFNFGVPMGTTTEAWLAAENGPTLPPRLLIYGATATDFNDSRLSAAGPRWLMSVNDLTQASVASPQIAGWLSWNFSSECAAHAWQLYYHRRGIRLCLADMADRLRPGVCPETATEARHGLETTAKWQTRNGFSPHVPVTPAMRLDALKAAGKMTDYFPFMDDYQAGGFHRDSLDRMLAGAARRGTTVLIVDLPVPADLDVRLFPVQFAAYRTMLGSAAATHGVTVVKATREAVGLSDADFSDLVHLNGSGAAKLSVWLRSAITAAGGTAP